MRIGTRAGQVWITVPRLAAQDEPQGLQALKDEVGRRWGTVDLLDLFKEADLLTGFTDEFTSVPRARCCRVTRCAAGCCSPCSHSARTWASGGSSRPASTARRRPRRVRHTHITRENLRPAVIRVVNATFEQRDPAWWGAGTACASDSKRFGSWQSNLMTEWHARYGGPGVMIYWHVERRSTCICSQLCACSASEVAAMIEGLLRHCTDAEIEANYTDTHGASMVGFAFCHLLGLSCSPG